LSGEEDGEDEAAEPLHDAITNRLKREELEDSGKLQQSIAENFSALAAPDLFQER
jgi:hypothetical protein